MAVNQTSTNSSVCEKIYRAINNCPLSSKGNNSSAPDDQKKVAVAAVSTEVPVIFNTPLKRAPSKLEGNTAIEKNGNLEEIASRNEPVRTRAEGQQNFVKDEAVQLQGKEGHGKGNGKPPIRTTSDVGTGTAGIPAGRVGKTLSRRDTFNDMVSDFINSVKTKIKTTSNDGEGRRSVSIK